MVREASSSELLMIDDAGLNSYHHLLRRGISIPSAQYTENALCSRDPEGRTLLQRIIATTAWSLQEIPVNLFTYKALSAQDNDGKTGFHGLAEKGKLNFAAKHLLTQKNLSMTDKQGLTCFHYAAKGGMFLKLPTDFVTEETLRVKELGNTTPAHWMATTGELVELPARLLTQDLLTTRDKNAWTVLHEAAVSGNVGKLPPRLITVDNMLLEAVVKHFLPPLFKGANACTVMQLVAAGNTYASLPIYQQPFMILSGKERGDWLALLSRYTLPIPVSLEKDFSHLQQVGSWAGL